MGDAELLFETLESIQDDMGAIKIEELVDAILLNKDDGAAKNIKQAIMIGLRLGDADGDNTENEDDDEYDEEDDTESDVKQGNDFENMPDLIVNPPPIADANSQPLKPLYTLNG